MNRAEWRQELGELVAGDAISPLEKFGVPAGIGSAIALLVAAAIE